MKALALVLCAACAVPPSVAQQPKYKNLQVFPADVSEAELDEAMLENLRGLGLRRLAGEGCLYCHVGDLETPRSEWNYASDAKPAKQKARVMMRMVRAINEEYLSKLSPRAAPAFQVTCTTCHEGRLDPRPLPDVLWAVYETDGIDGTTRRYQELRDGYFGAAAYDFRVHVLSGIATRMADRGAIDDAIRLAEVNVEVYPQEPAAKRAWVALTLERTIDADGVDAALSQLARLEPTLAEGVVTPSLLDSLAWRLNRSERETQGHALIEANFSKFPGEYTPLESLVFVRSNSGRKDEALALLEGWLDEHPDHARARRVWINLTQTPTD
ncbi:MAG TPA: c-type cytochrome [Candidatus Polarisedimenticolaceae bacterium]|nr:c-type cytochrome [Candidatus Polarisedimenticolaceae bacterium]